MDYCTSQPERRHNPVDSICRKLETIRWRGDREPNSPFQIPKLSSSSYNSSRCELRHNLGAILKKTNALHIDEVAAGVDRDKGRGRGALTQTAAPRNSLGPSLPPPSPFTPATNPLVKDNVTFNVTSTLGERRGGVGSGIPVPGQSRAWQRCHSTPAPQTIDSPSSYTAFSRGAHYMKPDSLCQGSNLPVSRTHPKTYGMQSYKLNFSSAESGNTLDFELPYPALVVKRLSMGEGVSMSETNKGTMSEVSLICEEDLLNTMFHACDTQRRGKVYVSHLVDYLRNTTCRSSEDSGLEELCNMLDPDHKDVSIDLDTYHAIMKEWIDDCRNNGSLLEIDAPAPAASPTKTPKKKAVKTKNTSPNVSELIVKAVSASNERRGVSLVVLKKALAADGYDMKNVAIKRLVANDTLIQITGICASGSVKLNVKAEATKAKKHAKKAVSQTAKKPVAAKKQENAATVNKYHMRMRATATTANKRATKSHEMVTRSHKKTKSPTALKKASAKNAAKPKVAKPKKTAAKIKEESTDDLPQDSAKFIDGISAKRSMLLNMTSGSLEGFGGDASRVDLETSDLMYCVADLQMSNTRLQDEVKRLKLVVESTEETNQKLTEENEDLHNQARMSQQLAQKEKMLKDEVEEMKLTLSSTEEGRVRASQHCKNMEKENQSLIANIASLQEENFKVTMEMDELQRRLVERCGHNTELQVQIHSLDALISEKDTILLEKDRQIEDLKAAVEEYSSVTELLRDNKTKLENQMQMMHPDMSGAGLTLSAAYRLNQTNSGSLQTELTLAQLPLEGVEPLPSMLCFPSALDETLDREVLLLLQGPNPEHIALEFRGLLNKLKMEFREEVVHLLSTVRSMIEDPRPPETSTDDNLQTVRAELDTRRAHWDLGLDQLAQYTDSLEKELIKMAGNMRRSRTDILHLSVRVQEQENQKRQLSEELDELKSPQDSREASCQTPDLEQQPEDDLDWDEEFALQDFLKRELEERNCSSRADDRQTSNNIHVEPTQTLNEGTEGDSRTSVDNEGTEGDSRTSVDNEGTEGDSRTSVDNEGTEGDSRTSVDTGGERGAGETFTPPFIHSDSAACPDPEVNCEPAQEEAEVLLNTHSQSVSQETDALLKPTHSNGNDVKGLASADSVPGGSVQNLSNTSEQDQAVIADGTPPRPTEVVQSSSTKSESPRPTSEKCGGVEESGGDTCLTTCDMSSAKSLSQTSAAKAVVEDSLLPVLEEEEEGVQDQAQAHSTEVTMAGTEILGTLPDGGSPDSAIGLGSSEAGVTLSDPSQADDSALGGQVSPGAKKDPLSLRGKFKRELELSQSMEAIEEHRVQGHPSEVSTASEKEVETSVISDAGSDREDKTGLSANDKEIETDFQRLSLGFKCDMFTLEKRLRLEERSRDLAEENVRKEVSSCQGLLQALIPLCEDDNQSMEIIQRLQKNLDILIQSMTRVSSRSEMLGAIHQESRIGKAVEVMIQHVDNLRRTYTKEHAELLELRESLMQSERSFGSHSQDDFRGKKQAPSQYYKSSSTRRVSIAAIPRSPGSGMHFDMGKTQDTTDDGERLTRRSPWKSTVRPPLKRYVSSGAWVDMEEPSLMTTMRGTAYGDSLSEDEQKEKPVVQKRRSSLSELGNKLTSLILPLKTPSPTPSLTATESVTTPFLSQSLSTTSRAAVARSGRGLWLWLALVVVLAGLLALLASLVMQPAADASPVGTGDSWMTIQQLLWPYTGLRHNGQPPI